jgi:hypothetical protein
MEKLDKKLDECHRLSNPALDLSGLKITETDAITVAAFLPKWCVETVLSPGMIAIHAMTEHAMQLLLIIGICFIRIVRIASAM